MTDLRICQKGRDGVCVNGPRPGEPCDHATRHPQSASCAKIGTCPRCVQFPRARIPAPADVSTPETDAERKRLWQDGSLKLGTCFDRMTDFARSLERRLAGALKELDELKGRLT